MKTSELIGPTLDWAVAKCEGYSYEHVAAYYVKVLRNPKWDTDLPLSEYSPSTYWTQGGPIIEREGIDLYQECRPEPMWVAEIQTTPMKRVKRRGRSPLIAAMRCYVASKLGDEVEIPEELK